MGCLRTTRIKDFLESLFADGEPITSAEFREIADANGIAKRTLERAARDLGIKAKQDGPLNDAGRRTWRWHPPVARPPAVLESVNLAEIAINLGLLENSENGYRPSHSSMSEKK
jgi:hypothetical protein